MEDLDLEINNELDLNLKQIETQCCNILKDTIQQEVYDSYQPKVYDRTYQLIDNVRAEIKNNALYVYINTGNMHYEANTPRGMDVTKEVPYWINYGHNKEDNPYPFMYNTYPSRNFIEKAKERIESEMGLKVEIMNNDL